MPDGPVEGLPSTTFDMPMNTRLLLEHGARSHGEQAVLTDHREGRKRLTYSDVYDRTQQAANALQDQGVEPGEVVGLYGFSTHSYMELLFAASGIGAAPFTINIDLPRAQQRFCVEHVRDNAPMETVFVDRELYDQFQETFGSYDFEVVLMDHGEGEVPDEVLRYEDMLAEHPPAFDWPPIDEDSTALLMFTSGTTGNPKAMAHSHRAMYLSVIHMAAVNSLGPRDSLLMIPPMFHLGWVIWALAPTIGAKLILPGVPYPDNLVDLFIEEEVTYTAGVPTLFQRAVTRITDMREAGEDVDLEGVQIQLAGQAPPTSLLRDLEDLGATTSQIYSFTESLGPQLSTNIQVDLREKEAALSEADLLQWKADVPGYLIPGVDAKLLDPDTEEPLEWDGETPGEFSFRAPWGTDGYWKMPDRTAETLTDDGYLKIGDLVTMDEHSDIEFVDRIKDVVKSGGEWIPSPTLEDAIDEHPAVDEACVIAADHEEWMERPVALVTLEEGADEADLDVPAFLQRFVDSGEIEKWWIPDETIVLEEFPISSTGKYDKAQLREQYRGVLES